MSNDPNPLNLPRCEVCGAPLTMEMERDAGICVDCQAEQALNPPIPERKAV